MAISCRLGPTEPPPEESHGNAEYSYCPEGTTQWGQQPINPIKRWCELDDGGLSGPYSEWWPSATVKGILGPQPEELKIRGWYENGEPVGAWQFWYPDGGLDRVEHHRPRTPPPPRVTHSGGCQGLFPLRCSDAPCGIRAGERSGRM